MKRKWNYAPKWVDYLVQLLYWFSWSVGPIQKLKDEASRWAEKLLDEYYKCERCKERNGN
jgi:hypothetical protein